MTVGCDPEFFLRKGGTPESAHFLVPKFGGKHNPLRVEEGMVQVDGTAVEFGIDPAKTAGEFVDRVDKVLLQVRERIPDEYDFNFYPVQIYDAEKFASIPQEAKELGCDPDFDAYTLEANPKPDVDMPMRTGAGHIHIGYGRNIDVSSRSAMLDAAALTKQLDAILYPASLLWDSDTKRRDMYGKPGAFRVKPYGVEYRVLSNSWLRNKQVQRWIFDATAKAFELLMDGVVLPKEDWEQAIQGDGTASNYYSIYRYINTHLSQKYSTPYLSNLAVMG